MTTLLVVDPMNPSPRDVNLPHDVTFDVTLKDLAATPDQPVSRTLSYSLQTQTPSDILLDGAKTATRTRQIGRTDTRISATFHVTGTGAGLITFRVLLSDGTNELDSCLVNLR